MSPVCGIFFLVKEGELVVIVKYLRKLAFEVSSNETHKMLLMTVFLAFSIRPYMSSTYLIINIWSVLMKLPKAPHPFCGFFSFCLCGKLASLLYLSQYFCASFCVCLFMGFSHPSLLPEKRQFAHFHDKDEDEDEGEDEDEVEKGDEDKGEFILGVLMLLHAHLKGLSGPQCAGT